MNNIVDNFKHFANPFNNIDGGIDRIGDTINAPTATNVYEITVDDVVIESNEIIENIIDAMLPEMATILNEYDFSDAQYSNINDIIELIETPLFDYLNNDGIDATIESTVNSITGNFESIKTAIEGVYEDTTPQNGDYIYISNMGLCYGIFDSELSIVDDIYNFAFTIDNSTYYALALFPTVNFVSVVKSRLKNMLNATGLILKGFSKFTNIISTDFCDGSEVVTKELMEIKTPEDES